MEQLMSQLIQLAAMAPHMPTTFFEVYQKQLPDFSPKGEKKDFTEYCLASDVFSEQEKEIIGKIEGDLWLAVMKPKANRVRKSEQETAIGWEILPKTRKKIATVRDLFDEHWLKELDRMDEIRGQAEAEWKLAYAEKTWRELYKVAEKIWEGK